MANVMFKRGTQANLNKLTSFVDGAFYLTTDTDRLYVAQGTSELVELNKSIHIVDQLSDLPGYTTTTNTAILGSEVAVGQFYYVKHGVGSVSGNILAVCDSIDASTNKINWTQVNPDTQDGNDRVASLTVTKKGTASTTDGLTYTITLTQCDKDGTVINANTITQDFTISASDIVTLGNVAVDIDATSTKENEAVIALGGSGADATATAGKVTIKAGDNVGVSVANNVVTIDAEDTTYTMSKAINSNEIKLKTGDNDDAGSVSISTDETYLTLDKSAENALTVNHKTQSSITAGAYGESGKTIGHRDPGSAATTAQFKIPKVTVDAAGHVTAISTETFFLPVDNDTKYTVEAATAGTGSDAGKLTVTINEDGDNPISATSEKILYNKITVDGVEQTVYNTESLGSFYSKSAIDTKMKELDAFTYKGTVGGTGATKSSLPTSGVSIGDTYKVAQVGKYEGYECKVGDLLIATGSETDGVITSGLTWTYVGTNAEADTQYTMSVASNKVTLTDNADIPNTQSVEIVGGTALTASTSGSVANKDAKITINHDASGVTAGSYGLAADAAPAYGETFNVPYVTVDAQGHVTSATTHTVTIPGSDDTKYTLIGDNTSKKITLKDSDNTLAGSVAFTQGNALTVTVTGGTNTNGAKDNVVVDVKHNDITRTDDAKVSAAKSAYSDKFTAVTGVVTNNQGHVTNVKTTEFQLPDEVTYVLSTNITDKKVSLQTDGETSVGSIQLKSSYTAADGGVKIDVTGTTTDAVANIDLVWGSF